MRPKVEMPENTESAYTTLAIPYWRPSRCSVPASRHRQVAYCTKVLDADPQLAFGDDHHGQLLQQQKLQGVGQNTSS